MGPISQLTELSDSGTKFLETIFKKFDTKNQNTLDSYEFDNFIKNSNNNDISINWNECSVENSTLTSFIAWFKYKTFYEPIFVSKLLFLMGYDSTNQAIKFLNFEDENRKVYIFQIYGEKYAGKAKFVQRLVKDNYSEGKFSVKTFSNETIILNRIDNFVEKN